MVVPLWTGRPLVILDGLPQSAVPCPVTLDPVPGACRASCQRSWTLSWARASFQQTGRSGGSDAGLLCPPCTERLVFG